MNLLYCIGLIDDAFIEEAEMSTAYKVTRKQLVRYSTLAAAASVGLAMTYWLVRSKKSA